MQQLSGTITPPPRPPGKDKIIVEGVRKSYGRRNEILALDGIDLVVKEGQFVCLVGPSGCGKSTLLRMMARLHHPTSGQVRITDTGRTHLAAMVFQNYSIFPWKAVRETSSCRCGRRGCRVRNARRARRG